jgi:hypothetical protein
MEADQGDNDVDTSVRRNWKRHLHRLRSAVQQRRFCSCDREMGAGLTRDAACAKHPKWVSHAATVGILPTCKTELAIT